MGTLTMLYLECVKNIGAMGTRHCNCGQYYEESLGECIDIFEQ